ncbi:flagellar biosynthesis anti-sigma factor FlgM [Psychromonas sp.]|nr:flagellar biosynthesis anti-sigma factor FlgM [Psychromonas sp.]
MSININSQATQKNIVIEQNKTQKQNDAVATDNTKAANPNKDSVQITAQAMNLNKMQKQTSSESQVNMKRVEALKTAILNGDYKINTERLAEKLGKFESDFDKAFSS